MKVVLAVLMSLFSLSAVAGEPTLECSYSAKLSTLKKAGRGARLLSEVEMKLCHTPTVDTALAGIALDDILPCHLKQSPGVTTWKGQYSCRDEKTIVTVCGMSASPVTYTLMQRVTPRADGESEVMILFKPGVFETNIRGFSGSEVLTSFVASPKHASAPASQRMFDGMLYLEEVWQNRPGSFDRGYVVADDRKSRTEISPIELRCSIQSGGGN